jgi:hypothetical protein
MPYTELTSYQFERGTGFTEESVLEFRVLALTAINELMRKGKATTATFPLSADELQLIVNYRASSLSGVPSPALTEDAAAAYTEPDYAVLKESEPDYAVLEETEPEVTVLEDTEPDYAVLEETEPDETFLEDSQREPEHEFYEDSLEQIEAESEEAVSAPSESLPVSFLPAAAAAHIASDPDHAGPPDDDYAAAARWLALAMRDDSEPYQPSLARPRG